MHGINKKMHTKFGFGDLKEEMNVYICMNVGGRIIFKWT
jgi:hypothetical protein